MSLIASRTTLTIWSLVTDLGPRVSPAITTLLVVASVSHAVRMAQGSIPAFGPSRKNRSTISSEIRSQNLSGGIEGSAAFCHFRQPVVLDLSDIHRRVPCCKGRRGSERPGDLVGQRFHIISKDRTVIGIGIKIKVAPRRSQFIFHRAQ